MAWSSSHPYQRSYEEPNRDYEKPNLEEALTTMHKESEPVCVAGEVASSPWEAPEVNFPVESKDVESMAPLQVAKGNKCPKDGEEAPTSSKISTLQWLDEMMDGVEVPTSSKISTLEWLDEVPVKLDCTILSDASRGRTRCSSSTASDVSGADLDKQISSTASDVSGADLDIISLDSQESDPSLDLPIPPPPSYPHPLDVGIEQMRSAHVEAVLSAVILTDAAQCNKKSAANEWLAKCTPDDAELTRVQRCVNELNCIVSKANNTWSAVAFGSHVNGLALKGSDLDATCVMPSSDCHASSDHEDPGGASAVSTLQMCLSPAFYEHPSFEVIQEIFTARVPIIKLRFENSLDVDFSCHNKRPLQNTALLRAYVQTHPCVLELILAVKKWAKAADVCGAADSKLSCYTFALMAVYFMQVDPAIRLPCLPTSAYNLSSSKPPAMLHHPWSCQLPLSVIIARFFVFYSELFAWGDEVVSVRCGVRMNASEYPLLGYRTSRRIHIEDPYDLKRNLCCVLGHKEEHNLRAAFAEGLSVVKGLCDNAPRPVAPRKPTQAIFQKKNSPWWQPQTHKSVAAMFGYEEEDRQETERQVRRLLRRGADDPRNPGDWKGKSEAVRMERAKSQESAATVTLQRSTSTSQPWAILEFLSDMVCPPPQCEDDEDDELKWWYGFAFGCTAYCGFAVYSGQIFRLALALSTLFFLLFCVDRRTIKVGDASGAAKACINDLRKTQTRRDIKHTGTSGTQDSELCEKLARDRKIARRARRQARQEGSWNKEWSGWQ